MVLVVLFSSAVTLVLTAIQLYLDYNRDVEVIEDRLIEIEQVHQRSLGNSLWIADYGSLATQLRGIVKLPDMQYLALHENGEVIVSVGTPEDRNVIAREFSIEHDFRGEVREIGRLTTVATVTGVYQRLFQRALGILASNAVKTFLVAGFMLLLRKDSWYRAWAILPNIFAFMPVKTYRRVINRHPMTIATTSLMKSSTDSTT